LATEKEWFSDWFDSPYYHTLYKHRDDCEARQFIDTLLSLLNLQAHARVADIACGRGRHAIYLNKKGYDVTGIDISENSITFAKQFENQNLHFAVHDMRRPFVSNYFDLCLNLFTSFGYFKTEHEHELAVKTMSTALKKGGILVLDFFNADTVVPHSSAQEEKTIDGITFNIKKYISGNQLIKEIEFKTAQKHFHFTEKVRLLKREDFQRYFDAARLQLTNLYGNYQLQPFDPTASERLILIGQKT
jgi:SAM-dependent methyltransferase